MRRLLFLIPLAGVLAGCVDPGYAAPAADDSYDAGYDEGYEYGRLELAEELSDRIDALEYRIDDLEGQYGDLEGQYSDLEARYGYLESEVFDLRDIVDRHGWY